MSSFAIGAVRVQQAERWLDDVRVDDEVFALRPDYTVVVITVDGVVGGPSDTVSERLLVDAGHAAGIRLADAAPADGLQAALEQLSPGARFARRTLSRG